MMQTVKDNWETYEKACYGKVKVTDVQQQETKQAFYCGAFVMIGLLGPLTALPEDQAVVELEKLYKEVEAAIANQLLRLMKRNN